MTDDRAVATTVVLPVWDAYVGMGMTTALASLTAQDVPARIVVVDNASEVPVPELGGVSIVRSPQRLTLGAARNLGLAQVSTPYAVVWDADDVMLPGTLALLEREMRADPTLAAFGAALVEDPSGLRHRWPRRWIALLVRAPKAFAALDCVWSLYPTTGATIMRADLMRDAGGYADADSGDDWCLGVSLAFRGRIGWSERLGRVYRLHDRSIWASHQTAGHLRRHAGAVRDRIRSDRGIASWARVALPLIAVGQHLAIAAHLAVSALRGGRRGRR